MVSNCPQQMLKDELFSRLPVAVGKENLASEIQQAVERSSRKVVVLDDDPTGTQTVHGVDVLTGWNVTVLQKAFQSDSKLFYILTNSRSLDVIKAREVNAEIAHNLCTVSRSTGVEFDVISRSDSTLRGHYPDELDVLEEVLTQETGHSFDAHLLIPAFFEGGRFTVDDIHYVLEGDTLTPAS
ncbi:MAG: hydroxyacid dehydrogenase, partial [Deltaproteobacteria bacterium]|nr:hydroxyacid dehydrogenase [Deltaproteobacteria bacterium]